MGRRFLLPITTFLFFGRLMASPSQSVPTVLSLDAALQLAEQHSPQLQWATALAQGANAAITTARAYPNPAFNTLAGPQYRRMLSAEPGLLTHFSVDQLVELPAVRRARVRVAQLGRESTQYTLAEARLGVRRTVKQAYFQVLRRRSEIGLARENLRLVQDLERRVRVQVEVGEAARLELTRSEAEVATAQTFYNSAQLRYVNAVAALRTAVGAPLGNTVELEGKPDLAGRLPGLDELRAEMLARHPALQQAQAEIRRAEARLASEREQRKPQPSFRLEYERQPDLGFYRFGVSIPVPLLNKREGPIAEASAAITQARAYADMRRLELTADLERAYGLYEVALQQIAAFEQGVLREAEAALQASEAAFKYGERGIIEVLDAQRVLRTVRLDFLNAQFDLQAALIDIEQLRAQDGGRP